MPSIRHSGKGKAMETIEISVIASEGGMNRQSTEGLFKAVKILNMT